MTLSCVRVTKTQPVQDHMTINVGGFKVLRTTLSQWLKTESSVLSPRGGESLGNTNELRTESPSELLELSCTVDTLEFSKPSSRETSQSHPDLDLQTVR